MFRYHISCLFIILGALSWARPELFAQSRPAKSMSAAEIKSALKKLQVVGTALYVAAHPDDENTRMITYLSKDRKVETAYLALTRGDGGQNLIGKEVRELLGIIRTQELLGARSVDGGQQFFSRANDFGYSKHPDETFTIWDKEKVLADAVWAIRKFRPDVIITRFSPDRAGKTHGHHTGSAIIALEAFEAAADPKRFPEQLKHVKPWQAKRIVWNTSSWFFRREKNVDMSKYLTLDVGTYNPLLGKSHGEIASASRSMHKSQGFGAAMQRGKNIEYFDHLKGDKAKENIFEDIDLSWGRIADGEKIGKMLEKVEKDFSMDNPSASISALLEIKNALLQMPKNFWVERKKAELDQVIVQCAGIWCEMVAKEYSIATGDSLYLEAHIISRGNQPVHFEKATLQMGAATATLAFDSLLKENVMKTLKTGEVIPENTPLTQPYWLTKPEEKGMYQVDDQLLIGLPENIASFKATFHIKIEEASFEIEHPIFYKWTDPVDGERYRPLEITPKVTVNLDQPVFLFASDEPKEVKLLLKSHSSEAKGDLHLAMPQGWRSEPASIPFDFTKKYEETTVAFKVFPPQGKSEGRLQAVVDMNSQSSSYSLTRIDYDHIPIQTLFPPAKSRLVRLDIKTNNERIGYIPGAGDAIPEALREVGYAVDILADEDMTPENLSRYDAIITGVRAYNTNERIQFHQEKLMDYVKDGGNMIVQYNTSFRLKTDQLAPYELKLSRDRVTVEEAPMKMLEPDHEVVSFPNRLIAEDFEGWVQERGLYFPNEWDERFTPIFECHDPGEDPTQGALLVADYGNGSYIYTGLSFFRELPAGVAGAYRLFANMISYRNQQQVRLDRDK